MQQLRYLWSMKVVFTSVRIEGWSSLPKLEAASNSANTAGSQGGRWSASEGTSVAVVKLSLCTSNRLNTKGQNCAYLDMRQRFSKLVSMRNCHVATRL